MQTLGLVFGLVASAQALVVGTPALHSGARAAAVMGPDDSARLGAWAKKASWLKTSKAPKGPFGGYDEEGWLGDNGAGEQVKNFEAGTDYLFFQGPTPKTGIQEDLPSFFSKENFADLEITPAQIAVTLVGPACFLAAASVVLA
ncbi:hypothetical protein AB1Y20_013028 [Prymnesium parvum]|uniref:Chlorophyll a-b binding protein, chloroplastic n=1 Tax=Prymnesium parvum TaxID=97485 RepID=A0AB34IKD1_PRYPA